MSLSGETAADYLAIYRLRARYGRSIDRFDLKTYRELFTEDATVDYSGTTLEGRDEIVSYVRENVDYEFSMHTAQMPEIHLDGDTATGSWYLFVPYVAADGTEGIVMGSYEDAYRRVEGEWKFARMTTRIHHDTGGYHTR